MRSFPAGYPLGHADSQHVSHSTKLPVIRPKSDLLLWLQNKFLELETLEKAVAAQQTKEMPIV